MKKITLALAGALVMLAGSHSAMAAPHQERAGLVKVQHHGHYDGHDRHGRAEYRQDRRELRREIMRIETRIDEKRRLAHRVGPRQERELRREIHQLRERLEHKQRQLRMMRG